jgi:predicted AAA+ superfamily ATPase
MQALFKKAWFINLLHSDVYMDYSRDPALFRRQTIEKITQNNVTTIVIDEIQRLPELLNEVHGLMEQFKHIQFGLTGSSARKLKQKGANLLAGRAIQRSLFPLCYSEIQVDFDLATCLQFGTLPPVYTADKSEKIDILSTYVGTYLKEEIQQEGLVRNAGAFLRFLDLVGLECGEITNFANVSRECQIPQRTVESYYTILEDTLVGFRLFPWVKSIRKRLVTHPKFYLFDTGVTNALTKRLTSEPDPREFGRLFEQWCILEAHRMAHYNRSEASFYYWRTHHGSEVDLIVEKHGKLVAAFEFKTSKTVGTPHLSGLGTFREENPATPCYLVGLAEDNYAIGEFAIVGWRRYLSILEELL